MSTSDDFPLLVGKEDYPRWAQHARTQLQTKDCLEAILSPAIVVNSDAAITYALNRGLEAEDITKAMIYPWIEKTDIRQREQESKAIGILRGLVTKQNQQILEGKSAYQIWTILQTRFKDTSPMSLTEAIRKASLMRMLDFGNPQLYCDAFRTALDQITGMLQENTGITQKRAENLLQGFMLAGVTDVYKPLVSQLQKDWKNENTDLIETCLSIERYNFSTVGTDTANGSKAFVATNRAPRAPKETCDFAECVESGLTSHYNDKC